MSWITILAPRRYPALVTAVLDLGMADSDGTQRNNDDREDQQTEYRKPGGRGFDHHREQPGNTK